MVQALDRKSRDGGSNPPWSSMAKNRFPKQGTEAWHVSRFDGLSVAKVYISKKWVDKEAYVEPTQVATVRIKELWGSDENYQINSKIIIDEPEQLALDEREVIRRVYYER